MLRGGVTKPWTCGLLGEGLSSWVGMEGLGRGMPRPHDLLAALRTGAQ